MSDQVYRTVKTNRYTISEGWLDVGDGHKIYYQQWGNKNAKTPILTFHGGPGGEFKLKYANIYDPKVHQVIFFDQRGCGNSIPYGKINNNETLSLIEDAKKILDHLGIEKVYLLGGSWGSTLVLLFGIKFNNLVRAIITGGVFLGTKSEINYLDWGGFSNFYPEVWEKFKSTRTGSDPMQVAAEHYKILE